MSRRKLILAARNATAPIWQVAPPAQGLALVLVGWRVADELEREAVVPLAVARILVRALARLGSLSYARSEPPAPGQHALRLELSGIAARLRSAISREPAQFWLVTTRDAEVAAELFEDSGFPWSLQGQVVLVKSADAPAPALDRTSLLGLMEPARPLGMVQLAAHDLLALVHAGVDGSVAAIIALNGEVEVSFLSGLEAETIAAGFEWQLLGEDEFAAALGAQSAPAPLHRL